MNARPQSFLVNLNRVLIFALTLTGLLMDGFQRADLLCTAALTVWLWLPFCTRMEASLLRWLESKRDHFGSAKMSPSVYQTGRSQKASERRIRV